MIRLEERKKVALLIESSSAYGRGLLKGITAYNKEHFKWSVMFKEYSRGGIDPNWLKDFKVDGIIARIESLEVAEAILKLNIPTVNLSSHFVHKDIPVLDINDNKTAKIAAEHLMSCGFKHFGFCGTDYVWSERRSNSFKEILSQSGFDVEVFQLKRRGEEVWSNEINLMKEWVEKLPKPIGIFAAYDAMARRVIEACKSLHIMVPEQVAILGVDNDEILCELSDPQLSSIIPDSYKTGYNAAFILDDLMKGNMPEKNKIFVEPIGIAKRRSTDIKAIDDVYISKALHFIHTYALKGITVADVLKEIPQSRRVFEKQFKKLLGHSPHEEIQNIRLQHVQELLKTSSLTQAEIAERTGFSYVHYMNSAFKKKFGVTPGAFKKNRSQI